MNYLNCLVYFSFFLILFLLGKVEQHVKKISTLETELRNIQDELIDLKGELMGLQELIDE
ncbi:hypothetical protein ELY21_15335 [Legionella sp. km535]|uniref:hypothetical protein n=1 Tax=Legionella sp. km535 TaxID=2498107 RepID=UPI000F8F3AC6|nr:hypothetical protein [Legionella sp. km535]RUR14826.1 hypothetical protein ELY21_15335 [Legionella sp. km535]